MFAFFKEETESEGGEGWSAQESVSVLVHVCRGEGSSEEQKKNRRKEKDKRKERKKRKEGREKGKTEVEEMQEIKEKKRGEVGEKEREERKKRRSSSKRARGARQSSRLLAVWPRAACLGGRWAGPPFPPAVQLPVLARAPIFPALLLAGVTLCNESAGRCC